jgi:serine/threonine protein kinase
MYFCKKEMKFKPKNGGNDEEDIYIHHEMSKFDITKYEDYITYTNSSSFVGTAEYASPELLKNNIVCAQSVDLWALGCILYKFFHGKTPFLASNDIQIFKNVIGMKYDIGSDIPDDVRDLITKLLVEDPQRRLGVGEKGTEYDFEALKLHAFFKDVSFDDLHLKNPQLQKELISPQNSQKDIVINTTSCVSNKLKSSDLNELNLNLSDNNISFFDTSDVFIYSPVLNYRRHYSCNNLLNLQICEYSCDTYTEDWLLNEDYIEIKEDLKNKNPSVVHEKIVKKKAWIIYNLIKLRLLSNGRLEVLDVYSNELLVIL